MKQDRFAEAVPTDMRLDYYQPKNRDEFEQKGTKDTKRTTCS